MQPLPSCPECGGRRALFMCNGGQRSISIPVGLSILSSIQLYACTCLTCGHTILRPHPADLEKLRDAEQRGKSVQFQ